MRSSHVQTGKWWEFAKQKPNTFATGEFIASRTANISRLYFPIVNEAGMLSWTSPRLHGSPAADHNEYLSPPLTAEDLPHVLIHRDFWIIENGQSPFSVSGLSPDGLLDHLKDHATQELDHVNAGPGWFTLVRTPKHGRYSVETTVWCPADFNLKIELMSVRITNHSSRPLKLGAYGAIPLYARSADNIRDHRHVTALLHRVVADQFGVQVQPTMTFDERGHKINKTTYTAFAFGHNGSPPSAIWPTEEEFLGEGGNYAAPAVVWRKQKSPNTKPHNWDGKEPIGGFRFNDIKLAPNRSLNFLLVGGIFNNKKAVTRAVRWAQSRKNSKQSLEFTKKYWHKKIHRIAFQTADRNLDHWLAWVNFQPTLRRLYGNSYLPQFDYGRGGRGWRDLWQDCLALLLSDPMSVREMLLHNFGGIRIDGSNATIIGKGGIFIADRNNIPRTWMDHGAWPTYTTLLYIDQTGDLGFLNQDREYFRDPQIHRCRKQDVGWNEQYGFELKTRTKKIYRGTVFEHMLVQNLTAFFNVGEHNVCRLEGADWNDGLDMGDVRGESVAFTAFYAWNLERLAQISFLLQKKGKKTVRLAEELLMLLDRIGKSRVHYNSPKAKLKRLEQYLTVVANDLSGKYVNVSLDNLIKDLTQKSKDLSDRIRKTEWIHSNQESFFNGYYDNDAKRVEGTHPKGVRMTLTGQVFPLMSSIATEDQVDSVIQSANCFLRDPKFGGIRLNTNFGEIQPKLGRAFSFAYGEKENGAVFSHMAVMYAFCLYTRRRAIEGRKVWSALYKMSNDQEVARIFPCLPEYFNAAGRGLYCYLTGSASWFIYLILTQVYGIRGELGHLLVDPQLTKDDFGNKDTVVVRAIFADRPLCVRYLNPQCIRAGEYEVKQIKIGSQNLNWKLTSIGGAIIQRATIESFSKTKDTELRVLLGPKTS